MSDSEKTECSTAMNAAITRALDFCGNDEKQADALGRLLGVSDVDETKHLETPKSDPMEQRQWVASRAFSKMQESGGDPYDAIESAWSDLAQETPEPDADTSDESNEPEEAEPTGESNESESEPETDTEETDPFSEEDESEGEMLNADDILSDA